MRAIALGGLMIAYYQGPQFTLYKVTLPAISLVPFPHTQPLLIMLSPGLLKEQA